MSEPIVRGVVVDRPSALRGGDPERPVRITVADAAYADLTPHEARTVAAALEMEAATAGPTGDASAPATPGEGHRTGTGGPDAPGASEGLDAAIEAASDALMSAALDRDAIEVRFAYGHPELRVSYDALADAAVRTAAPILAEEIARRIEALPDLGCEVFHETVIRSDAAEIAREVGRG